MSTSVSRLVAALVVVGACLPQPAHAQAGSRGEGRLDEAAEEDPVASWARVLAEATAPRWIGPRVPWAPPSARPQVPLAVSSWTRPVAVHATDAVAQATVLRALRALEDAHAWMEDAGWGAPVSDAGRGGDDGLDLYLVSPRGSDAPGSFDVPSAAPGEPDDAPARSVQVGYDSRVAWTDLDTATTFASVDADVEPEALEACVTSAYAQAVLAGSDPAEAPAWRRALGTWLGWQITGTFCDPEALAWAQARAERALVGHAPGSGEAGAFLLAVLSARHDGGTGRFVRDLWQLARQRTWEGDALRAEPDLWHAIEHALEVSREPLVRIVPDLAVGRWFTGGRAGLGARAVPFLRDAPGEVVPAGRASWARMPRTLVHGEPELGPFGSAYALVDVEAAPPQSSLRVWLRGELGVRWSLVAVRLDRAGRELGRMEATPRREPRAYLPVELDATTAQVLLVVTLLPWRAPEADEPDEAVRGFKLVVDRGPS